MSSFCPKHPIQVVTGVAILCLLPGCGGSGSASSTTLTSGYYRGSVTYDYVFGLQLSGTQSVIASVQDPTDFTSIGGLVSISGQGSNGVLNDGGGAAIAGTMVTQVANGQLSFTLTSEGHTVATGTIRSAQPPSLGRDSSMPPSGTYVGQSVIFGPQGPVSGLANVLSATVDADGTFVINTGNGVFNGGFGPNHAITNGSLFSSIGTVIGQTTSQYSFDGTTLTFRFDQLDLSPRTEWITLTKP